MHRRRSLFSINFCIVIIESARAHDPAYAFSIDETVSRCVRRQRCIKLVIASGFSTFLAPAEIYEQNQLPCTKGLSAGSVGEIYYIFFFFLNIYICYAIGQPNIPKYKIFHDKLFKQRKNSDRFECDRLRVRVCTKIKMQSNFSIQFRACVQVFCGPWRANG